MGKRQHWLPQFYLRGFRCREAEGAVPRVWTFFRDSPDEPRLTSVRDIANQSYLYAPLVECGARDHSVDERLQEIETLLGHIWPQVAEGYVDLEDESIRKALSLFVATLHARHPSRIDDHTDIHQRIVAFIDEIPKDAHGDPLVTELEINGKVQEIDPSGWKLYKARSSVDHGKAFVDSIVPIAGEIATILMRRRWAIVATEDPLFATCDSPLILSHRTAERFGYNTPGVTITMPLSPFRFLSIDDTSLPNAYYESKPGFPEAMNYQAWCSADRYLLSSINSHTILRGVVQFGDYLKTLCDNAAHP